MIVQALGSSEQRIICRAELPPGCSCHGAPPVLPAGTVDVRTVSGTFPPRGCCIRVERYGEGRCGGGGQVRAETAMQKYGDLDRLYDDFDDDKI